MRGIILAGGLSTRLPFKQLLASPQYEPVMSSCVRWIKKHTTDYIVVLRSHDGPVARYARSLKLPYVIQRGPDLLDAIDAGDNGGELLVAFSDCWPYDFELPDKDRATVIKDARSELDGWSGSSWVDRSESNKMSFIGAFRCSKWHRSETLMGCFNSMRLRPYHIDNRIWDCGTVESYSEMWNAITYK